MTSPPPAANLLQDRSALLRRIADVLFDARREEHAEPLPASSAVLFLVGDIPRARGALSEPCLVLNKRSSRVRQAGDLCYAGGGISPRWDPVLARVLQLPLMPLRRWRHYDAWRRAPAEHPPELAVLLATALREAFEEMRLNPLGTTFLGLLPPQPLHVRHRAIRPVAAWLHRPQRLSPNWEVEKVVNVPIRTLLDPANYARLRLRFAAGEEAVPERLQHDFPCVRLQDGGAEEILWGATYRITARFLDRVFGFREPALEPLPLVEATLDATYMTGPAMHRNGAA